MSGYFVKKPFPMHFTYICAVYIAHMVGMHYMIRTQKHSVKKKVDCMLVAHKNIPHTQKHKGLNDVPFP